MEASQGSSSSRDDPDPNTKAGAERVRAEVLRLGRLPQRKRKPSNKDEVREDKLAKRLAKHSPAFRSEVRQELYGSTLPGDASQSPESAANSVDSIVADVHRLGRYPQRKFKPANNDEMWENGLAKRLRANWHELSSDIQAELLSLKEVDGQILCQVRRLGRWPCRKKKNLNDADRKEDVERYEKNSGLKRIMWEFF